MENCVQISNGLYPRCIVYAVRNASTRFSYAPHPHYKLMCNFQKRQINEKFPHGSDTKYVKMYETINEDLDEDSAQNEANCYCFIHTQTQPGNKVLCFWPCISMWKLKCALMMLIKTNCMHNARCMGYVVQVKKGFGIHANAQIG